MRFAKYVVVTIMGVALLFALHQYVGYLFTRHSWKGMSAGDWGTWIGSIGTVGALIGTIVLATSDRRSRRDNDYALAQVTAASFVERIRVFQQLLQRAIAELEHYCMDIEQANFHEIHRAFSERKIWTPADTIPLIVLPKKVAMKLSSFATRFDTAHGNLIVMHRSRRRVSPENMRSLCKDQINEYRRMLGVLDDVMGVCLYASLQSPDSN